jgi:hypothetical protein
MVLSVSSSLVLAGVLIGVLAPGQAAADLNKVPALPPNAIRGNPSMTDALAYFQQCAGAFPGLVTGPFLLATTSQQNQVVAFCFGDCPPASNQTLDSATRSRSLGAEVLIDALHHAREPPGLRVMVEFSHALLQGWAAEHGEIQALLTSRALWFVPAVNPDGYIANSNAYSHGASTDQMMVRKNRRKVSNQGSCFASEIGVDLNRNYPVSFGTDPSSLSPCQESYQGPQAASEVEVQGMQHLVLARNFSVALNLHTFGKSINMPYATEDPLHRGQPKRATGHTGALVEGLASGLSGAAGSQDSEVWEWGPAVAIVKYPASGEAGDWMLQEGHVLAFAPELGPKFLTDANPCDGSTSTSDPYADCFWPLDNQLLDAVKTGMPLLWYASAASTALLAFTTDQPQVLAVQNITTQVNDIQVTAKVRNAGARNSNGQVYLAWTDPTVWSQSLMQSQDTAFDMQAVRSMWQAGLRESENPSGSQGRKRRELAIRQATGHPAQAWLDRSQPLRELEMSDHESLPVLFSSTGSPVDAQGVDSDGQQQSVATFVVTSELPALMGAMTQSEAVDVALSFQAGDLAGAWLPHSPTVPYGTVQPPPTPSGTPSVILATVALLSPADLLCVVYPLISSQSSVTLGTPLRLSTSSAACSAMSAAVDERVHPSNATLRLWQGIPFAGPAVKPSASPSPLTSPSPSPLNANKWSDAKVSALIIAGAAVGGGICLVIGFCWGMRSRSIGWTSPGRGFQPVGPRLPTQEEGDDDAESDTSVEAESNQIELTNQV